MFVFFFFKQKTAYEMRISDWSSDVCSSDLLLRVFGDVGIQIVHEHPERGFGQPTLRRQLGATGSADRAAVVDAGHGWSFGSDVCAPAAKPRQSSRTERRVAAIEIGRAHV